MTFSLNIFLLKPHLTNWILYSDNFTISSIFSISYLPIIGFRVTN